MAEELFSIKDDINGAFDSIALCEDEVVNRSYLEGKMLGIREGEIEGFHLGYHRGCELGYEIGYYKGFIKVIHYLLKNKDSRCSDKVIKAVEKLQNLVECFPVKNVEGSDLIKLRDEIRVRYKRICSLLKIEISLPFVDKLAY